MSTRGRRSMTSRTGVLVVVSIVLVLVAASCGTDGRQQGADADQADQTVPATFEARPEAEDTELSSPTPPAPATVTPPTSWTAPVHEALTPGWTTYTTEDGLASDDVLAIDVNADGSVWAMTDHAFNRFDGTRWSGFPTGQPTGMTYDVRIIAGPSGRAWAQCAGGAGVFSDEPASLLEFDGSDMTTHFDCLAEFVSLCRTGPLLARPADAGSLGGLWGMGSAGSFNEVPRARTLLRFDGATWTEIDGPAGESWDDLDVRDVGVDPDNRPLVLVADRAMRLDPDETWSVFPVADVGDVFFSTVAVDGTIHRVGIGVDKTIPGRDEYRTFHQIFDQDMWISDERDSSEWLNLIQRPAAGDAPPMMAAIGQEHLFYSGLGGLLWTDLRRDETVLLTIDDGLASNVTRQVATGPDGAVWVATAAGISRFVPAPTD